MNDPRDFLPDRYKNYFKINNSSTQIGKVVLPNNKTKKNNLSSLIVVSFLMIGFFASTVLVNENSDSRRQALMDDPYGDVAITITPTTVTLAPSLPPHRPKTELECRNNGSWINNICYLFWETLPGGTHMVIPPDYSPYGYTALIPLAIAEQLAAMANSSLSTVSSPNNDSNPPSVVQSISFSPNDDCNQPFVLIGKSCVPDQTSSFWNSRWVNNNGCGAMQALYYALKKNPSLNADVFLNDYYSGYYSGNKLGNTYDIENTSVIESFGYLVEPYPKNMIYNGIKETAEGGSFFIKGVFSGGVNHFFSIENIYVDESGRTVFEPIDSYYKTEKCFSSGDSVLNCYDGNDNLVTSVDLSDKETSTYLILPGEENSKEPTI